MGYLKNFRKGGHPSFLSKIASHRFFLLIFILTRFSFCYAQKDTLHVKSQFVINNSYTSWGQIEFSNIGKPENNTRIAYGARLRTHTFLFKKLAFGAGIFYFDYYYSQETGLDLHKPWNAEVYTRFYPLKNWYIESSVLYGGFVRDSQYLNKLNWIGEMGIGFETHLKGNFFLEVEIRSQFPLEKNSWVEFLGQWGHGLVGINYYFEKRRKK
jgi:hypothetical protein